MMRIKNIEVCDASGVPALINEKGMEIPKGGGDVVLYFELTNVWYREHPKESRPRLKLVVVEGGEA